MTSRQIGRAKAKQKKKKEATNKQIKKRKPGQPASKYLMAMPLESNAPCVLSLAELHPMRIAMAELENVSLSFSYNFE